MPRAKRKFVGGLAYHVLNRANGRLRIFRKPGDLGNRTSALLRGEESSQTYAVDVLTNRYDESGAYDVSCCYDNAGNTIVDQDGYQYFYDEACPGMFLAGENRLVKIEDSSSVEVASHDYDTLGRRIRVIDKSADPDVTTLYYYNPVLAQRVYWLEICCFVGRNLRFGQLDNAGNRD